jgi:hypothetical protein
MTSGSSMLAQNQEAHVFLADKFHLLNIFIPAPIT